MSRRWLRLVGGLTLATFLVANGPVNLPVLASLLPAPKPACGPVGPCPAGCGRDAASGCCCDGCCCDVETCGGVESPRAGGVPRSVGPAPAQADVAQHSPCPSCPGCPHCPGCPAGCCWCCAAKVPCCVSASPAGLEAAPSLGDCLAEFYLSIPAAPPSELLHPPRA
jgi:hypothetical protein